MAKTPLPWMGELRRSMGDATWLPWRTGPRIRIDQPRTVAVSMTGVSYRLSVTGYSCSPPGSA